ncbi:MAG: hypothetical protein U0X74_08745 [Anaerolineales bacterium]
MENKKQFLVMLALFSLLVQSSCSTMAANLDSIVSCSNGTNPIPISQDFQFPGDLLFLRSDHSEILALNGETHKLTSVFKMPNHDFYGVSPLSYKGETLVLSYQKPLDKESLLITVLSNRGIVETKSIHFPVWGQSQKKPNSWTPVDWVNNDYLLGMLYDKENHEDNVWEPWLLNVERLEWKSLSSINNTLDSVKNSSFSISPDLTKVLYLNKQYQLVLYDLIQNKAVWTYNDYDSPIFLGATWSEDGKMVTTVIPNTANEGQQGILVLDQNGKILLLMNFREMPLSLSLSNDEKFLSFWGYHRIGQTTSSGLRPVIRMLDMNTGLSRDLCMLSENAHSIETMFWSPDQQFLAFNFQNSNVRNEVIIQKLNDPQLRVWRLDDETPYFDFLGWSKEHWNKAEP